MASPAQIAANRLNALRSTGPTSEAGKAVSRFNNLKSGIDAKSLVIPGEDPAQLEALSADYHRQFHAGTPLEQCLLDSIIHADWELRRLRKAQAKLWAAAEGDDSAAYARLVRLERRIDSRERALFRALRELQGQMAARAQFAALTAPVRELPPGIGFGPSISLPIPLSAPELFPSPASRSNPGRLDNPALRL